MLRRVQKYSTELHLESPALLAYQTGRQDLAAARIAKELQKHRYRYIYINIYIYLCV